VSRRPCVIGIDCSTTAAKAIVFDREGAVVGEGRSTFPLSGPDPGWHEQDPPDWWTSTATAVREAVSSVEPRDVVAFGITHQRESFVCLNEHGRPLRPAILWLDGRAGDQIARYGSDEVHRVSGKPPDVTPAFYKLLWLREREPASRDNAAKVVEVHAYLAHCLTGEWLTSWASADPLGLVDMERFEWSAELLEMVGLDEAQLPRLCPPGAVLGELGTEPAKELGLDPGLPIVAGAGDGQSAGLGADVTRSGLAYLNLGTAVVSGRYAEDYRWNRAFRTLGGPIPGTYTLETLLSAGTYLVSWFMERFERSDDPALGLTAEQILETAAAQVPPGSEGLLLLPFWNAARRRTGTPMRGARWSAGAARTARRTCTGRSWRAWPISCGCSARASTARSASRWSASWP
jgi:xylulokinase